MVIADTHASLFVGLGNMGRPMAINYSPRPRTVRLRHESGGRRRGGCGD